MVICVLIVLNTTIRKPFVLLSVSFSVILLLRLTSDCSIFLPVFGTSSSDVIDSSLVAAVKKIDNNRMNARNKFCSESFDRQLVLPVIIAPDKPTGLLKHLAQIQIQIGLGTSTCLLIVALWRKLSVNVVFALFRMCSYLEIS